jgi:hypothetical protein
MGIDGNDKADQLTRQGSSCPFIGHEPALGISAKTAREVIRDGRIGNMWSTGSPFMDKDRIETFSKDRLLEELENCLVGAETS